jgi:ketosteroid isomerase-like protein
MTNDIRHVVVAGDIAVVYNSWRLTGTRPDGSPVELGGLSGDVLRRHQDGGWGMLVPRPLWPTNRGGSRPCAE